MMSRSENTRTILGQIQINKGFLTELFPEALLEIIQFNRTEIVMFQTVVKHLIKAIDNLLKEK